MNVFCRLFLLMQVADPKTEVLENIRRRHGLLPRAPSVDNVSGLYSYPGGAAATAVQQAQGKDRQRMYSESGIQKYLIFSLPGRVREKYYRSRKEPLRPKMACFLAR